MMFQYNYSQLINVCKRIIAAPFTESFAEKLSKFIQQTDTHSGWQKASIKPMKASLSFFLRMIMVGGTKWIVVRGNNFKKLISNEAVN